MDGFVITQEFKGGHARPNQVRYLAPWGSWVLLLRKAWVFPTRKEAELAASMSQGIAHITNGAIEIKQLDELSGEETT